MLEPTEIDVFVRDLVAQWPPLSQDQRERLRSLLGEGERVDIRVTLHGGSARRGDAA